jgi:hypothetical protein
MKKAALLLLGLAVCLSNTAHSQEVKSDAQLRAAIERHEWHSARHGYRFLPSGIISVDGYTTGGEKWSIRNGLLYREMTVKGFPYFPPTKIIEINDRQLVEQEISGPYKGSVEVMYAH